jgi:hypothetical protein
MINCSLKSVIYSGNYFGGWISTVAFIVNHGHATRVMWTPPLRESFGYPLFCIQTLMLTWILSQPKTSKPALVGIIWLTTHFILFWQVKLF